MTNVVSSKHGRLLAATLRTNAVFSFACGLALAVWSLQVATWIGFPSGHWLRLIGLGLVAFGVFLWVFARQHAIPRAGVVAISALDLGWVVVTTGLALGVPGLFNETGVTVVLLVSLVVLVFFELQAYALWRAVRGAAAS